jgi:hypothetical protein
VRTDNGNPVSLTIPENLKAGNYLLRSELISLQRAAIQGDAEFYPNCAQLTVGGSGTGVPDSTVSFPGEYAPTDKGVFIDVYNADLKNYVFPGPPVATLGASSGSGAPSVANTKSASPASSAKASSTRVPSVATSDAAAPTSDAEPAATATASASASKATAAGVCKDKHSRRRRRSEASRRRANHARSQAMRGHRST